jgi:hypothetical protein
MNDDERRRKAEADRRYREKQEAYHREIKAREREAAA